MTRDEDELATSVHYPSGAQRTVTSDAAGRVTGARRPRRRAHRDLRGGRRPHRPLRSTAAPAGAAQSLDTVFDGMQPDEAHRRRARAGRDDVRLRRDHAARRRAAGWSSGADDMTLTYTRDADGVLTGIGPFTYERNGPDRALSAITDGDGPHRGDRRPVAGLADAGAEGRRRREVPARADRRRDRPDHARHEVTAGERPHLRLRARRRSAS